MQGLGAPKMCLNNCHVYLKFNFNLENKPKGLSWLHSTTLVLEINFIIQLFARPITIFKNYYFIIASTQTSLLIRPITLVIKLMTCNNTYNLLPKRRQHIQFGWQNLSTKANVQCIEIDMFIMKNHGNF